MNSRKFAIAASIVVAASLTLTACGSGKKSSTSATTSSSTNAGPGFVEANPSAVATTSDGKLPTVASDSGTGALTPQNFSLKVYNAMLNKSTYHVSVTSQTNGGDMDVDVKMAAAPTDLQFSGTIKVSGQTAKIIEIGTDYYLNTPSVNSGKWQKSTTPGLISLVNPIYFVYQVGSGITVKQSGAAQTIDGVSATPWVLSTAANSPAKLSLTVWVGPDNLPRRVNQKSGDTVKTYTFTNWGKPVSITAPAM